MSFLNNPELMKYALLSQTYYICNGLNSKHFNRTWYI